MTGSVERPQPQPPTTITLVLTPDEFHDVLAAAQWMDRSNHTDELWTWDRRGLRRQLERFARSEELE